MKKIFGRKAFGLFLILLFAAGMLTYRLSESPQTGYDEGILIQMADNFFQKGSFSLRTNGEAFSSGGYMTTGFPALFPVGLAMQMFGKTLTVARFVTVLFTLGLLMAAYVVVARSFGRRSAWFSTALIATHASVYVYGKSVLGEIPGLFYIMLFLLGLERLSRKPDRPVRWVVLTALALGLAAFTKPVFFLVLPAAFVTLLMYRKRLPVTWKTLVAAAVTILACFAFWALTQFYRSDDFASILLFYRDPYFIQDVLGTMWMNLKRFGQEATPMYVLGLLLIWSASLGWRMIARIRKMASADIHPVEAFCYFFTLLVLFAYLRTPGFYRYFFLANVAILIAFPFALEDLFHRIVRVSSRWKSSVVARDAAFVICVLLILAQGHRLLRRSFITTTYGSTQTAQMTEYFNTKFERDRRPYVYDVPEVVPFLPTKNYSQWIEVSGNGRFQVGLPLDQALEQKVQTIILNEKRLGLEQHLFKDYQEIARASRYVILERKP